ncbi:alpha/beta fold hydrolase [Kiritimatiellota bacterium B12222]|nr:alpha/beta fold hydrolase [Kiritimatiellota bacterium B12222]
MKASTCILCKNKLLFAVIGLFIVTSFCSCTVMNYRYKSWDKTVSRNEDGILEFAQAWEKGEGENALLFVHGFADGPHVWEPLGTELAERGYSVKALRLPGWNEPIENKRTINLDDWEEAIVHEVSDLKLTHPKVVVLSHSMGGCLTTVLAQNHELTADALVLYAPMFAISNERSPLFTSRTWFKIGNAVLPRGLIIESKYEEHARVNLPRPKTARDPFSPKNFYNMLFDSMDIFEAQSPELDMPLCLVLPGEDHVVSNPRAQQWFEDVNAPIKTLVIDEPSGHVLPLDINELAESDRLVIWLTEQGIAP